MTEKEFAFLIDRLVLQLRRPEQEKDGLSVKEKRVRAVIDILSAEIPEIQVHRFRELDQLHGHLSKLDAVGGRDVWVEWQIPQSTAKLCFTSPAVAKEQDLDLRVLPRARLKVFVMSTDFIQDVFVVGFAANFRGQVIKVTTKEDKFPQRE